MPGWVLNALGDALLSFAGSEFTSDQIRTRAGSTVDAWLTAEKSRRNVFSGWFQSRSELYHLERCGQRKSSRPGARGRFVSVWRFPEGR